MSIVGPATRIVSVLEVNVDLQKRVYGVHLGRSKKCKNIGCPHNRIQVRWNNGVITWPCLSRIVKIEDSDDVELTDNGCGEMFRGFDIFSAITTLRKMHVADRSAVASFVGIENHMPDNGAINKFVQDCLDDADAFETLMNKLGILYVMDDGLDFPKSIEASTIML